MTFQPWFRNAHVQTLLGSALRAAQRPLRGAALAIPTPDGDELPALWSARPGPLALVVVHGVGGHHLAREGVSLGRLWQFCNLGPVLLFSLRGAFRAPRKPHLYHAGCSDQLDIAYRWLQQTRPRQRTVVVGYSLGANILVKWLAEQAGELSELAGAVSVSNPWDLKACCQHLEASRMGRFYRYGMVRTLKQRGCGAARHFPELLCPKGIAKCVTFHDYDRVVTAPLHGFSSVDEYYGRCSAKVYLSGVRYNLVCLDAEDDPFVPGACRPRRAPSNVTLVRPRHGGHLGFIGLGGQLWMEQFICQQARCWV